jgi:cystathionine gamma-lyase
MTGFSGMISFYLKGNLETVKTFLKRLKLIKMADSLGGVESLIKSPFLMDHSELSLEERENLGIKENLLRLSVGIEDVQDIINDLKQALLTPNL